MIEFSCPQCGKWFKVPHERARQKTKCPGCNQILQVPNGSEISSVYVEPPTATATSKHSSEKLTDLYGSLTLVLNWILVIIRRAAWGACLGGSVWIIFGFWKMMGEAESAIQETAIATASLTYLTAMLLCALAIDRLTRRKD